MEAHVSLRVRRTLILAAIAVAATLLFAISSQRADAKAKHSSAITKGPKGLKFYKPPKSIPGRHGTLIWARKGSGLIKLANSKYTDLVLYSSRTPQGQKTAVSGTVSVPKGKPPKGGWPVITWAHGTTGVADICAPSRNSSTNPATAYISYIYPDLNAWLAAGYAVVQTDYQGLGTPGKHPYRIGEAEGRSVLDIVSAARQLDPKIGQRFLISGPLAGRSVRAVRGERGPELDPQAEAARDCLLRTGLAHPGSGGPVAAADRPSSLTALATLFLDGASTQSSAIDMNKLLSDEVLPFYPLLQSQCLSQLGATNELGGIAPSHLERSGADVSALNPVLAAMNPAVKTTPPVVVAQGTADTTVFPFLTDQLVGELQGLGDQVTYNKYPGVDHGGVVNAGEADALSFFEQALPPR